MTKPQIGDPALANTLRKLRDDFGEFLMAIWRELGLDKKAPLSEIELDFANYVAGKSSSSNRRVALAFRGYGKTHITAALICYRLFRDPDRKVFLVSQTGKHTRKTVELVKEWTRTIWFLAPLQPKHDQLNLVDQFQCGLAAPSRQPSVSGMGLEQQLEGNRAHTIIADDIETKINSKTTSGRDEMERLCSEFVNILYPDSPELTDPVEVVYIGTPKHADTLYMKLHKKGYDLRSWPILYPSDEEHVTGLSPLLRRHMESGRKRAGDIVCHHRFSVDDVSERRSEGLTEFRREHMLIADAGDRRLYPLRIMDLIVMDVPKQKGPPYVLWASRDHNRNAPIAADIPCLGFAGDMLLEPVMTDPPEMWSEYRDMTMRIDPAGVGADETAIAIGGTLGGFIYVHGVWGQPGGVGDDAMSRIADLAYEYRVSVIRYESNIDALGTYGRTLESWIERKRSEKKYAQEPNGRAWCPMVEPARARGRKEDRIIEALEPAMSAHRLVMSREALRPTPGLDVEYELQYQIANIRREPKCLGHDDRIDALAALVSDLSDNLGSSVERASVHAYKGVVERRLQDLGVLDGFSRGRSPNFLSRHRA